MYDRSVKEKAINLRLRGKTYNEIADKLPVAKSTLSLWLKECPIPARSRAKARKKYFLKHVQALGAAANHQKKVEMCERLRKEARTEVGAIKIEDLLLAKSVLSALYWAEGSKNDSNGITFANTDPNLLKLFITLLRRCYDINEKRIRIRLNLHWYHSKEEVQQYWSRLLDIPIDQFKKTYVKKRSQTKRFRKNYMGICFIRYSDSKLQRSLMSFAISMGEHLAPAEINVKP
jgi:hypothetical protein